MKLMKWTSWELQKPPHTTNGIEIYKKFERDQKNFHCKSKIRKCQIVQKLLFFFFIETPVEGLLCSAVYGETKSNSFGFVDEF